MKKSPLGSSQVSLSYGTQLWESELPASPRKKIRAIFRIFSDLRKYKSDANTTIRNKASVAPIIPTIYKAPIEGAGLEPPVEFLTSSWRMRCTTKFNHGYDIKHVTIMPINMKLG